MQTVSVIVPFLNEEENLERFCEYIDAEAGKADFQIEVIFVDDGSGDNSVSIVTAYEFNNCKTAKLIQLSKNFGSHAAIRAGISKATGDYCTYIEADLETPEDMLDVMYENIIKGYDAVYIEKRTVKKPFLTKIASSIFSYLMRKHAVPNYQQGGINNIMMKRNIVEYLNNNIENNSSLQLQIINAGFKSITIGMHYRTREKGKTKWSMSRKIKLFIDSFISFSYFPIRLVSFVGAILALAGIIYGIYLVILRITGYGLQEGYATIAALLLFGFGITNISLGIIAEYLWRTLDAAQKRPVFIISKENDIKH